MNEETKTGYRWWKITVFAAEHKETSYKSCIGTRNGFFWCFAWFYPGMWITFQGRKSTYWSLDNTLACLHDSLGWTWHDMTFWLTRLMRYTTSMSPEWCDFSYQAKLIMIIPSRHSTFTLISWCELSGTIRPWRELIFTELINLVSLVQSHHKHIHSKPWPRILSLILVKG